jgi:ribosomal subunit interface protein
MDLHLIGRGTRITDALREASEHKLSRLGRMEPRLSRLDVEVIAERNPRRGGAHRVEVIARVPRKVFRAHAEASDVEAALDLVSERLERQIRDHHEKKRARLLNGARRAVTSAQVRGAPGPPEAE